MIIIFNIDLVRLDISAVTIIYIIHRDYPTLLREVFCLWRSCCLSSSCLLELKSSLVLQIQNQLVSASVHELQISCLKFS